ncbi:MAG: hypothetical protein SOY45_08890 [Lachnospiraceae bacterium]|nr:hypothetical protein [Lachnospiraceae bacterium]MDY4069978.1 hypothetical protein [Lachnospiraceae bacterium]
MAGQTGQNGSFRCPRQEKRGQRNGLAFLLCVDGVIHCRMQL